MTKLSIPPTMRAAQGLNYGPIDEMISVKDGVPVPRLMDLSESERKNKMLIKVLAVSLAPGDCRVLSGKTRELQGPPSMPYIPGGDCCGIVVELPEQKNAKDSANLPFQVGDRVAVRFVGKPYGALGEYAIVSTLVADKVPQSISSTGAAALAGASPATVLSDRIRKGEKVLVLGAGGGMGSHFCQIIRNAREASVVVGVAKDPEKILAQPIGCHKAFGYTKTDIWSMEQYQREPFDAIVDLASGGWLRIQEQVAAKSPLIVKPASLSGRYITTTPDTPVYEAHNIWQIMNIFLWPALWRAFVSRTLFRRSLPGYTFALSLPEDRDCITRTLEYARSGKMSPILHPDGPYEFTTKGVQNAFHAQESRHAKGKVVIHVADE